MLLRPYGEKQMHKARSYKEAKFLQIVEDLPIEELQKLLEEWEKEEQLAAAEPPLAVELDEEELAAKYVSEASQLDTIKDREQIKLYNRWVEKNTIRIPLWQGPVQPGRINLLVAGTGTGKSTFLQNLAHHLSQHGSVLYLSAEEDQGTIAIKLIQTGEAILKRGSFTDEKNIIVKELKPGQKRDLVRQLTEINKDKYDYILLDYIKSSLIAGDITSFEAISQIVDAFNDVIVRPNLKTVCFAAIQANSTGNKATPSKVAASYIEFVEGKSYAPKHAASIMFLMKDGNNSQVLVCKSRNMERKHLNKISKYVYGGLETPYLEYCGEEDIKDDETDPKDRKFARKM